MFMFVSNDILAAIQLQPLHTQPSSISVINLHIIFNETVQILSWELTGTIKHLLERMKFGKDMNISEPKDSLLHFVIKSNWNNMIYLTLTHSVA